MCTFTTREKWFISSCLNFGCTLWQSGSIHFQIMTLFTHYSNPILASSPMPQSASLGLGSLSSSLVFCKLRLLLRLAVPAVPLLLILPVLNPDPLLLVLFTLSAYSGGASEGLVMDVRAVSGELLRVGVGDGVISVEEEISTSSASRYHFRRRV
jgi:hypothetical protein